MKLLFLFFVFIKVTFAQNQSTYIDSFNKLFGKYSVEKKEAYFNAANEFLNLNFFHKGKGMVLSPGLINLYGATTSGMKKIVMNKMFGINYIDGKSIGLFSVEYLKENIGVLGCVACHSGQAAGFFIVGLGNKNVDVQNIGSTTVELEKTWKVLHAKKYKTNPTFKKLTDEAIQFAQTLANPNISNVTQGMVPTGVIQTWFYRQANVPISPTLKRAAVKIPALWGYETKRKVGQFSDGLGDGSLPGWGIAVELTAGQTAENVMEYLPKITHAEDALHSFLPPKYPFEINVERAASGKVVFENTCMQCHGSYEFNEKQEPIFAAPLWVPHLVVKTDAERLDSVDETFLKLVANNPLNSIIKAKYRGRGFFAPRLNGIWSRFPYLHNASIPSVMDLLTEPKLRPVRFSLKNAGAQERFDAKNLGLTLDRSKPLPANEGDRSLYDTTKVGHSNQGHEFGLDLSTQEKSDLIEYLKTL